MFTNTLLESSAARQKARRWPVAAAFTLQAAGLSVMLIIPLLTTGLIPLSAKAPEVVPVFNEVKPEPVPQNRSNSGGVSTGSTVVVANTRGHVIDFRNVPNTISDPGPDIPWTTDSSAVPIGIGDRVGPTIVLEKPQVRKPLVISHMDEGMLLNKIIPEYPVIAIRAGVQGEVTLHAMIGRDGSIESLSVIKGHPLLINAAREAVRQWRYRPYVLNGEPIEVETYIVVNFKKGS